MKHVKQLLSALLVLAVVLSLLPAGVLKASAAEALAALDIGYPHIQEHRASRRGL